MRCSPRLHRCDPRGTATETVRRSLTVTEAVAARGEAEVEVVAGMNTLTLDDPAAEVIDDDKAACVRDRAFRSPVVDVHHSNEVPLRRTMHDPDA